VKLGAVITVAVLALAVVATASTAGAAGGASHQRRGLVPHIGHARHLSAATRTAKPAGLKCIATCAAYESTINQYFTDVAAAGAAAATDNVYSVATQYSSIQYNETFDSTTNAYVDQNPYPTSNTCHDSFAGFSDKFCLTDHQLQAEIGKVITARGWPKHSPTSLYFIFTPANVGICIYPGTAGRNACTTNAFCAYHSNTPTNSFLYAVEPDAAAISGGACDAGQHPAGSGADATINTISHEQNEAITDPLGTAWTANDANGDEMADLCAYDFGTPQGIFGAEYNQTINGHNYYLQLEYSNQDSGCVPYLGGPVTAPDPRDGSGPLVYHNGSVMTTNTVYAIYWIPGAPANSKLPTISGTAKVGNTLKATNGTWSYAPKFTYRWLRCSAAGTVCKGITGATKATYKLVTADTGHRIEVRVTGTNAVGNAAATSAPTAPVKK
jgi:hypothetical protein